MSPTGQRIAARPLARLALVAEVVAYAGLLVVYVMVLLPPHGRARPFDIIFYAFAAVLPLVLNYFQGDTRLDSGLRLDNLATSAKEAVPMALLAGLGIACVGLAVGGFHWRSWKTLGDKAALYLAWGPVQHYLLNAFALRRLMQAGIPAAGAVVFAAALFAMIHAPNWPLIAMTFGGGLMWATLFLRQPNLFVLGLCHGSLAILLYHAWPIEWTQQLTVGRAYLERMGH